MRHLGAIVIATVAAATVTVAGCSGSGSNNGAAPGIDGSQDCALAKSIAGMTMQPLISTTEMGYAIYTPTQSVSTKNDNLKLIKDTTIRSAVGDLYDEYDAVNNAIKSRNSADVLAARDKMVKSAQTVVDKCGDQSDSVKSAIDTVTGPKFPHPVPFDDPQLAGIEHPSTSAVTAPTTEAAATLPPLSSVTFTAANTKLAVGKSATIPTTDDKSAAQMTVTSIDDVDLADARKGLNSSDAKELTSAVCIHYQYKIVAGDPDAITVDRPEATAGDTSVQVGELDGDNVSGCSDSQDSDNSGLTKGTVLAGVKGQGKITGALIDLSSSKLPAYSSGLSYVQWVR